MATLLICASLVAWADPPPRIEIDYRSPRVENDFTKRNPNYKERAGSFYEREYLPGAADYLFEVCSIDAELHPYMMEILRAFIYDWADAYMRGNGGVSAQALEPIVTKMETRLLALMDEGQRERFPAWRHTKTGKNKLKFIMGGEAKKQPSEQDSGGDP